MNKKIVDHHILRNYGRPLSGSSYPELSAQLQRGERLVGVFDRLTYSDAPIITSEQDFNRYYKDYTSGLVMYTIFYAVDEDDIKKYAS